MFFRKKREEENAAEEAFRGQVMKQLQALSKELKEEREVVSALCSDVKQNGKDILRHGMALEDCMDMLEEMKENRARELTQRQEARQEQERLLNLVSAYQEQLWSMKRYAEENDSVWHRQLQLVEKAMAEDVLSCGITTIAGTGSAVSYELHEVLEVRDTEDPEKDRTVAAIIAPGYLYRGAVRQKAKVAAYRLQKAAGIEGCEADSSESHSSESHSSESHSSENHG